MKLNDKLHIHMTLNATLSVLIEQIYVINKSPAELSAHTAVLRHATLPECPWVHSHNSMGQSVACCYSSRLW